MSAACGDQELGQGDVEKSKAYWRWGGSEGDSAAEGMVGGGGVGGPGLML